MDCCLSFRGGGSKISCFMGHYVDLIFELKENCDQELYLSKIVRPIFKRKLPLSLPEFPPLRVVFGAGILKIIGRCFSVIFWSLFGL